MGIRNVNIKINLSDSCGSHNPSWGFVTLLVGDAGSGKTPHNPSWGFVTHHLNYIYHNVNLTHNPSWGFVTHFDGVFGMFEGTS